ncbi:MAG: hypothetical protein HYW25_01345 [Candidatus Aenigmarchaeota archaeon]|nr:hypothetical protein [Candidatus Aenigmarchaeota archaeon]
MAQITLPVIKLANGESWIPLHGLSSKIVFRAEAIRLAKFRVADPSGHRMDQAEAEGSAKFRPKTWDISKFQF